MTASELFDDLKRQGFTLRIDGDNLRVYPGERLNDVQRDLVRQHKHRLMDFANYPSDQTIDALADAPPDWSAGPVQLVERVLISLDGRLVAFAPEFIRQVEAHNALTKETWEKKQARKGGGKK